MAQRPPLIPLPLVPRAIAAPLFVAALVGCAPMVQAQAPAQAVSPPATAATAAAPTAAAHDSTPPLVNGVELSGVSSTIAIERPISGHLVSLNARYKLRSTMTVFEPGGYIGAHHHAGPGMRYVLSGELTSVEAGHTHVYRRGDWFYESGDTLSVVSNRSSERDTILNFEILPADWYGPSTMPAPGTR